MSGAACQPHKVASHHYGRRPPTLVITGWFLTILVGLFSLAPVAGSAAQVGNIRAFVTAHDTGFPIAGASVRVDALDLQATSDSQGRVAWYDVALSQERLPVTVVVSASGFGDWTMQDVPVLADDTLILKPELRQEPVTIVVPPPRAAGLAWPEELLSGVPIGAAGQDQSDLPLPETIRVRVTGYAYCDTSRPYTVEVVDFKQYVKNVLPNEWSASYADESLRSGAMAVKMYAWSIIADGGKWPDADVYDSTCDQVYIPGREYQSTNDAVDTTWNWRLMRENELVRTFYRHEYDQCPVGIKGGNCMGQVDSQEMALEGATWDEILFHFYSNTTISEVDPLPGGYSLRFNGIYNDDENRVKIRVDDPENADPGPPVDVGAQDFTIDLWIRAPASENISEPATCGTDQSWRRGNMLVDRDRYNQDCAFGLSIAGGKLAFGVRGEGGGDFTLCGTNTVTDDQWHHIAAQRRRSDGWLWLFVDGVLEAQIDGPDGDISYPDDGLPGAFCGRDGDQPCTDSDPFVVLGAEKHELGDDHPSFSGWMDEIRFSNVLRYTGSFEPPTSPFAIDGDTVAIYRLDEGFGNIVGDSSGHPNGPSEGVRIYGGVINGPEWSWETPWEHIAPTPTPTPTTTGTPQASATPTATNTPTSTATGTATSTSTNTPDSSATPTASPTATLTSTTTATHTATSTATAMATNLPDPSTTPTFTPTPTNTATASATATPSPTATGTTTPPAESPVEDINLDGHINVLDVQLCVNVFLGTESDSGIIQRSDVNGDGAVNVLDVQHIVNAILTG
jgi:hypothetical protein